MTDSKQKKIETEVAHESDAAEQKGIDEQKGVDEQKEWDNPKEPEASGDKRNLEQLERQKKEAVRRKDNLTDNDL